MEAIRELIPFVFGLALPVPLSFALRPRWSDLLKTIIVLVLAVVLGASYSLAVGELADDLPEAVRAVIVDTCLIYTGSQVAYRFFWKPVLSGLRRGRGATGLS